MPSRTRGPVHWRNRGLFLCLASLMVPAAAWAVPPNVIPYQGVLSLNGELMSGDVSVRFSVDDVGASEFSRELEAETFSTVGSTELADGGLAIGIHSGAIFQNVWIQDAGWYTVSASVWETPCVCPDGHETCTSDSQHAQLDAPLVFGSWEVTGLEGAPQVVLQTAYFGARTNNRLEFSSAAACAYDDVQRTIWLDWVKVDRLGAWAEEWSTLDSSSCAGECPVSLYNGRFSIALGTHETGLAALAEAGDGLLLNVELLTEGGDWVAMGSPQALAPSPYALWAAAANDMAADNVLVSDDVETVILRADEVFADGNLYAETVLAVGYELHSDSTITANSASTTNASVGGNLIVQGDTIEFASGDNGDGGVVFERDTVNDILLINPDGDFAGGVTFSNGLSSSKAVIYGDLDTGHLSFEGTGNTVNRFIRGVAPFIAQTHSFTGGGSANTGISRNYYNCWVGSIDFEGGSIDHREGTDPIQFYTYHSGTTGSNWYVTADFATDSDETVQVGVVCAQDNMMTTGTWF